MVSHDSVAGHGHVASHAYGHGCKPLEYIIGGSHCRHCPVRKAETTCGVGLSALELAIGSCMCNVYKGHWTLAEWSLDMG